MTTPSQRYDQVCARLRIPTLIQLDITYRCSFRCAHCVHEAPQTLEMPVDLAHHVIEEGRRLGTLSMCISGGEPLVHPHAAEIIEAAARARYSVTVKTNGLLLAREDIRRFLSRHTHQIDVTLFSLDDEVNRRITGVAFSTEELLAQLKELNRTVYTRAMVLVLDDNADDAIPLMERLQAMGLPWTSSTLVYPPHHDLATRFETRNAHVATKRAIQRHISRLDLTGVPRVDQGVTSTPADAPGSSSVCVGGRTQLYVAPDGAVWPCVMLPLPIGRVPEDGLGDIARRAYDGKFDHLLHNKVADEACAACPVSSECSLCPGISYRSTGTIGERRPPTWCEDTIARIEEARRVTEEELP